MDTLFFTLVLPLCAVSLSFIVPYILLSLREVRGRLCCGETPQSPLKWFGIDIREMGTADMFSRHVARHDT